ncbi:MAG: hypothetical protein M3R17_20160 [Bacteroidota bacterium]|nr:hypothetical protein [Bacteroidota bacterium]
MKISDTISIVCPVAKVRAEHEESRLLLSRIRKWIALFMIFLVLSGITAFPVYSELHFLLHHQNFIPDFLLPWLYIISDGIDVMATKFPFLLYGYDWLAYAHIVIALFFIGVYRNPIQNAWVLRIGMIACTGVFVLAAVCGQIRGIPFFWTLIDCSFGLFGIIPLLIVQRQINKLEDFHSDLKMI